MNVKIFNCVIFRYLRPCYTHAPVSLRSPCRGHRQSTSQPPKHAKRPERSGFSPTATSKYDWIGPPDRLSNLRPIIYHIPENETPLERKLRHLRQETEDWNHEFWTNQNFSFSKEKEEYVQLQLTSKGLSERDDDGELSKYRQGAKLSSWRTTAFQSLVPTLTSTHIPVGCV
ncbi:hypothetical protein R3I93_013048 [Phoxinus phoxinus]|uniref:Cytochrome c oxidase assembly factor 8 n=1 Tax=Phoxinus phoxinus TaxID=58324 RepID=A0AAN9H2Y4_9TELE